MGVTADFMKSALQDAGFSNVTMECCEREKAFSEATSWTPLVEWVRVAFVTGVKPN